PRVVRASMRDFIETGAVAILPATEVVRPPIVTESSDSPADIRIVATEINATWALGLEDAEIFLLP
ncbi:MAG: hypothetical protein ACREDI_12280, partial [Roseiarcus sp.]